MESLRTKLKKCCRQRMKTIADVKAHREAIGQTNAGRYLFVLYKPSDDGVFVITAYELKGNDLTAFRRRRRRRWRVDE
jgi:hypothetical protein